MRLPRALVNVCRIRLACVLMLVLAGCGGDESGPAAPVAPDPGRIASVQPADRAHQIAFDTAIWCESLEPLDPATVRTTTVFLKSDTKRLPITVSYDPATRRIHVAPDAPLALFKTYTVELSEGIRTTAGAPLTGGYWWQFTTISVRAPDSPQPMNGATGESPCVLLQWKGLTESSAGTIEYELRSGSDSLTATDPATPPLAVLSASRFLTRARWSQSAPNWWSVRARNRTTGESASGLAWRFDCLPADTPSDTIEVPRRDHAYFSVSLNRSNCIPDSVVTGILFTGYYRWRFAALDTTWRIASAMVETTPYAHWQSLVSAGASVWAANADWAECASGYPGPPFVDDATGKLADVQILRPDRVRFTSDALTAHTEAMIRFGGYYGYVIRSSDRIAWYSGRGNEAAQGKLRIVVYRPAAPQRAAARR